MIRRDLHTHTCFSDGKNTPEEMVLAALARGMETVGFSEHSYTAFDPEPCMPEERTADYLTEIHRLQQKYAGQIRILCGIEQDFYSGLPAPGFDYVIGSVHYVSAQGAYIAVDDTPEILRQGTEQYFGGDIYALTESYWENVSRIVQTTNADIIGHLDLVRKFNRDGSFFDETHPRYRDAAIAAVDALLQTGRPFEINTGAMSRGYQDTPYPADFLLDYIQSHGGRFLLSSDSHRCDTLLYGFDALEHWSNFTL